MAEVVHDLLNCDPAIRLKLVCEVSNLKYNVMQGEISDVKVPASEDTALELRLDIDELQEFHFMCTRSMVRSSISQLIACVETVCKDIPYCHRCNLKEERKWSDIMAGRHLHTSKTNPAAPQPIATVVTSKPPQHFERRHELTTKKTPKPQTVGKGSKYHQNMEPSIKTLGDSHARGIAGELLYQLNHHFNIIGYVKPNAGLTEVLKTANKDLSKLTKMDTIIVVGGSNDIDKNAHRGNLTSLVKFLDGTQNTNIILTEVPMRNDKGIGSPINEQITNYNKKLHKVTKQFKHVKLTRVTTNREHFTKHGLHLNKKGKETITKGLIKYLPTKQSNQNVAAIQLPWRDESGKVDARTAQTEKLKVIPNIDTDTVVKDAKELCNTTSNNYIDTETIISVDLVVPPGLDVQQGDKHESNQTQTQKKKEIDNNPKSHRNCPKIRNDDFLWN